MRRISLGLLLALVAVPPIAAGGPRGRGCGAALGAVDELIAACSLADEAVDLARPVGPRVHPAARLTDEMVASVLRVSEIDARTASGFDDVDALWFHALDEVVRSSTRLDEALAGLDDGDRIRAGLILRVDHLQRLTGSRVQAMLAVSDTEHRGLAQQMDVLLANTDPFVAVHADGEIARFSVVYDDATFVVEVNVPVVLGTAAVGSFAVELAWPAEPGLRSQIQVQKCAALPMLIQTLDLPGVAIECRR